MFVRTKRLSLRPGWIEDAPALAAAMGHEKVVRNLATAPWPYGIEHARNWLSAERSATTPLFVITTADGGGPARIVGGMGVGPFGAKPHELGFWITPDAWGRGYATEAVRALIDTARHSLRIRRLTAGHMTDNPASGAVLRKAGFRSTGRIERIHSLARGGTVPCHTYTLDLKECVDGPCPDGPSPKRSTDDERMKLRLAA